MDDPKDPKSSRDEQVFRHIIAGVNSNVSQPMRFMGMGSLEKVQRALIVLKWLRK